MGSRAVKDRSTCLVLISFPANNEIGLISPRFNNARNLLSKRRSMRKTFLILIAICSSVCLMTNQVSAQTHNRVSEKNVKLVRGKKVVLTGSVRDGDEVLYRFKARAGQRITVKVIGRDADFTVYLNHGLDVEPVARETKSWSGTMPPEFDGHCEIGVHSTYKLAAYRLEVLLK